MTLKRKASIRRQREHSRMAEVQQLRNNARKAAAGVR